MAGLVARVDPDSIERVLAQMAEKAAGVAMRSSKFPKAKIWVRCETMAQTERTVQPEPVSLDQMGEMESFQLAAEMAETESMVEMRRVAQAAWVGLGAPQHQ